MHYQNGVLASLKLAECSVMDSVVSVDCVIVLYSLTLFVLLCVLLPQHPETKEGGSSEQTAVISWRRDSKTPDGMRRIVLSLASAKKAD